MSAPGRIDDRLQRRVERKGEMAEYVNVRLLNECDEGSMARALLLLSELHGMCHSARECGLSVTCMRRQLNGTRHRCTSTRCWE